MSDIPNTVNYMIAGYAVIFGGLALYLASMLVRRRNLQRDLEMMRELEREEQNKTR